jgi:RNA recognition motif-containing protein
MFGGRGRGRGRGRWRGIHGGSSRGAKRFSETHNLAESTTLRVDNIPDALNTEDLIREHFSNYGPVSSVVLKAGRQGPFAFINFPARVCAFV